MENNLNDRKIDVKIDDYFMVSDYHNYKDTNDFQKISIVPTTFMVAHDIVSMKVFNIGEICCSAIIIVTKVNTSKAKDDTIGTSSISISASFIPKDDPNKMNSFDTSFIEVNVRASDRVIDLFNTAFDWAITAIEQEYDKDIIMEAAQALDEQNLINIDDAKGPVNDEGPDEGPVDYAQIN
jgi:hypothetical protein